MQIVDWHTHHPSREGETVIQQDVDSLGIHPWRAADADVEDFFDSIVHKLQTDDCHIIKAIGECGIDKLCTVPLEVQIALFKRHIALSEQYGLPLIIHCVKAQQELLDVRRECRPSQQWIYHGFRGKPQQMQQLVNAGLYISFGFKHNVDALRLCPAERRLFESDTSTLPVRLLYEQYADLLNYNMPIC